MTIDALEAESAVCGSTGRSYIGFGTGDVSGWRWRSFDHQRPLRHQRSGGKQSRRCRTMDDKTRALLGDKEAVEQ